MKGPVREALAWVLAANPNVVVIPGTTRLANLKSNLGAADIALTAAETASLTRAQILQQAGTAMVAQANQIPQGVLSLLK